MKLGFIDELWERNEFLQKEKGRFQKGHVLICRNHYFLQFKQKKGRKQMSKGPNFKLTQAFGYKGANMKIQAQDIITTIKFNKTGDLLALGDQAGRIIIFESNKHQKSKDEIFDYYAQFQGHMQEFDCLKSESVSEQINDICWLNSQGKYHKLLTTNSNTIKLWKMFEKPQRRVVNKGKSNKKIQMKIPDLETIQSEFVSSLQTSFPSKHHSEIHTISNSNNQQYLLSFDDYQGFMWNLQRPDQPYIAIDYLKGMEPGQVKQKISCGKYHPTSDSILAYGTNKKTLKMHDIRVSSSEAHSGVIFKHQLKQNRNFFTDLLANYTSVDFLKNGKYIIARDFLTVKVWDVCQNRKPILQVTLQQNYKQKLCEMYENDCIYDKFQVTASPDGNSILTGNYNNNFHLIDVADGANTQYELNFKKQTVKREIGNGKFLPLGKMDYDRMTNVLDFSRQNNMLAVASLNCFFIYSN